MQISHGMPHQVLLMMVATPCPAEARHAKCLVCSVLDQHLKFLPMILMQVMYAVCSGSEANDLALRIARANRPGAHVCCMPCLMQSVAWFAWCSMLFHCCQAHGTQLICREVCCLMSHPVCVFVRGLACSSCGGGLSWSHNCYPGFVTIQV